MRLKPRPLGKGTGSLYVLSSLLLLTFLGGGTPEFHRPAVKASGCLADVNHPLGLRVVPLGPIVPGATVTARVEIQSRVPLDGITLEVLPAPGVRLLTRPRGQIGSLSAGQAREETFTLLAPAGPERSTVEVQAEAFVDGTRITRGTVLNLVFEEEPSRTVPASGGRTVREVEARRVDG